MSATERSPLRYKIVNRLPCGIQRFGKKNGIRTCSELGIECLLTQFESSLNALVVTKDDIDKAAAGLSITVEPEGEITLPGAVMTPALFVHCAINKQDAVAQIEQNEGTRYQLFSHGRILFTGQASSAHPPNGE